MHAVVLAHLPAGQEPLAELAALLRGALEGAGYHSLAWFDLASMKLAYCQGEFDCWVTTPGRCRSKDAEQDIIAEVHKADALVTIGPVVFGAHGYALKRAIDRLICLLSPFFEKRAQLTHHGHRYERHASLYCVGYQPHEDLAQAQTFRALADANGLNLLAPAVGATVVHGEPCVAWADELRELLASRTAPGDSIESRAQLREELWQSARAVALPDAPAPKRAAFLIGSAKPKGTSTSEHIARSLAKRLEVHGIEVEFHYATEFVRDGEPAHESARALAACDLLVLASPLYVDALPALATHALEQVAKARATRHNDGARMAAVINCGFPEAEHNRTVLRVTRHFAEAVGYGWSGGLPLGGGGAIAGRSLDDPSGPALHVAKSLELTALALSKGKVIPDEAIEAMAKAPFPDLLYRLLGDLGWRVQAYQHGLPQRALVRRPLEDQ